MLKFDLDNENETILNYRERVRQCEASRNTRWPKRSARFVRVEQEHQIDLATALGKDVPLLEDEHHGAAK